jgi:hypothetical protein
MYHFAYGSNLDPFQMRVRCPDARLIGIARLDGFRVCFPRRSRVRDSAVISIEPAEGESVWGVIYELDVEDLQRLDDREGFIKTRDPSLNQRNRITVRVENPEGQSMVAEVYVAVPSADPGLPSAHYVGFLVGCAAECGLPKSHLVALASHMPLPAVAEDEAARAA